MNVKRLSLVLLLSGAVATVGCNGDDNGPTGPTLAQLTGAWLASQNAPGTEFMLTWNQDPDETFDFLAATAEVHLTVVNDGSFTILIDFPDAPGVPDDILLPGTFELDGNNVTVTTPVGEVSGTISLTNNGNRLTMVLQDVALFDFDGDGITPGDEDDDARLDAVMDRQAE